MQNTWLHFAVLTAGAKHQSCPFHASTKIWFSEVSVFFLEEDVWNLGTSPDITCL